jgi:hypothetical protein
MNIKYTALCGLYCRDCIPSRTRLFELADELKVLLDELGFENYAELKSRTIPIFREYRRFLLVLDAVTQLKCKAPCTEGGCKTDCRIRPCVIERNLSGCWECWNYKTCGLLEDLKNYHPNLEFHLGLIRDLGEEEWVSRRKKHYRWQKD